METPQQIKIGRSIHRLDIQIRRYIDTHLNRRKVESVTGNNGRIIGFLAEHEGQEICQRDLESAFGITRSTASKVVALMERKGLIERMSVARDARLKQLALTDRSRALVQMMQDDSAALEATLLHGFTDDERAQLQAFIARIRQNLTEGEPQ